jgi:hypothetical protein
MRAGAGARTLLADGVDPHRSEEAMSGPEPHQVFTTPASVVNAAL